MISLISPIYNESENVEELVLRIEAFFATESYEYEVLLVNDGSRDESLKKLLELTQDKPRYKVIDLKRNYGQTAAMMAGFNHAKYDIIIPIDADLQNDPNDIVRLVRKLEEGYDVVSGWRSSRKDALVKRVLLSNLANALISKLTGVRLHDYGCSLKAYRKSVIEGVRLYGEMHRFIPIYASWNGAKIAEIEVSHHPRTRGESKYGMERVFKVVCDLIVVLFLQKYAQKPMYVFGFMGLVHFLVSFSTGSLAIILKFFAEEKSLVQTPLPVISAITFMLGSLCILMGLLAEISMRTYHESQGKAVYAIKHIYKKGKPVNENEVR